MDVLEAEFTAGATVLDRLPAPVFAEIAFAGRSNVGKSSLINSLVSRRKLVRTSSAPGCTRAINVFRVRLRIDGDEAHLDLVDLPGYGYAQRSKAERRSWGPLIEGFLAGRPGLRGTVVILDIRRGAQEEDLQLIEFLESLKLTPIVVCTKIDKVPTNRRKLAIKKLEADLGRRIIAYSSVTGQGRHELWGRLLRVSGIDPVGPETQPRD